MRCVPTIALDVGSGRWPAAACLLSALLAHHPLAAAQTGSAQPKPDSPLPLSAFEDDPIGVSRSAPEPPPRAAAAESSPPAIDRRYGPQPESGRAVAGEVLSAMPSVRETRHQLHVHARHGLALFTVRMRLENSADVPAEARYRLPVPQGTRPVRLRVCLGSRCRVGVRHRDEGPWTVYDAALLARGPAGPPKPIAELRPRTDDRGPALQLRAAPISPAASLDVELSYLSPAALVGGAVHLWLPPRGMDPRVAPTELTWTSDDLTDLRINGRPAGAEVAPQAAWAGTWLTGRARKHAGLALNAVHYPCAQGRCVRLRAAAGAAPAPPVDLVLALDASPSTEGPARSRTPAAIAAILDAIPRGSTVRAVAFAARTKPLITEPTPVEQVSLDRFRALLFGLELGATTRVAAAARAVLDGFPDPARRNRKALLVVVGDGGLTMGDDQPFAAIRHAGVELWAVNLADDPLGPGRRHGVKALRAGARQTGGEMVFAGAAARIAQQQNESEPLRRRMAVLFAPVMNRQSRARLPGQVHGASTDRSGPLRAGEQWVVEGALRRGHLRAHLLAGGSDVQTRPPDPRDPVLQALATAGGLSGPPTPQVLSAVEEVDLRAGHADFPDAPRVLPKSKAKARRCDRRGPAFRRSGINRDEHPIVLAHARACAPADPVPDAPAPAGEGMPASPLLKMLRARVIPVARGCFRRDRAGRADYEVRAVFRFEMADREVISSRVEGRLPAPLRRCLEAAIDALQVPPFSGLVRVSYPLHTQREPPPEQIEITAATERLLEEALQ